MVTLVHGCHTLQTCSFAISHSVLLYGDIMWKELITALESDPRHVNVTSIFFYSSLNLTVTMDMFVVENIPLKKDKGNT